MNNTTSTPALYLKNRLTYRGTECRSTLRVKSRMWGLGVDNLLYLPALAYVLLELRARIPQARVLSICVNFAITVSLEQLAPRPLYGSMTWQAEHCNRPKAPRRLALSLPLLHPQQPEPRSLHSSPFH